MADENQQKTPPRTPEDIEKELTVANFASEQARTLGLVGGGALLGWAVGKYGLAKTGFSKAVGKFLSRSAKTNQETIELLGEKYAPQVTALGGAMVGGMASNYQHWIKVERERLSVQEINKDVASIMEKRVQFEEAIDKQHRIVQDMLERHDGTKNLSEKVRDSQDSPAANHNLP